MQQLFRNEKILSAFKDDFDAARDSYLRFDGILRHGIDIETNGKPIAMSDAVALPNASILVPTILTEIMREGIEPMLIGTSLLERMEYVPGMEVMMPDVGALQAEEIGLNNMDFPEFEVNIGQGQTNEMRVTMKGLMVKFPERVLRADQFGIYNSWIRKGGQAVARFKEQRIFDYISSVGTTVFDNVTPTSSLRGLTSGRDLTGSLNGSFTADDLFDMYAQCLSQGFRPDTILVHPLAWAHFVKDPILREFAIQNGGGSFFAGWEGDFDQKSGWSNFGKLGEGGGRNTQFDPNPLNSPPSGNSAYQQTMNSAPRMPSYFPFPLRVVASPFMPFFIDGGDEKRSDILMFDSRNLGLLVVESDPEVQEWDDIKNMFHYARISEAYGIHIPNEGQAIVAARNINLSVSNEFVLPARATVDASTLTPTPTNTVLVP